MISPWRAILARLSNPRLYRAPRARRRARRPIGRSLEALESRLLLSGSIPGLPYNDSSLAPAGLQSVTAMPNLTVFNVKNYGATGNGTSDDTVAIRSAINAAVANGGGIIYFPAGNYAVDNQPGDTFSNSLFPAIFTITTSNLVFMGAGASNTTLSGYMPGLKNPVTNWNNTGDSYSKISRFGMFQIDSTNAPISNIQFRSLNIDGNAGYTGNSTVGGSTTTGDGWDMSHKALNMGGHNTIDGVLVFNCVIDNWRGEELFGGGNLIGTVNIINDDLYSTNADAVSISGDVLIANTTLGGTSPGDDIYNGVEDFALGAPQRTVIQNSTIISSSNAANPHGNGIAYLGLATSSLVVTNTTFENNQYAILYSETANNVVIQNSTFSNNIQSMVDSILGLYPQYPTGFSNFLIEGNTFTDSGSAFLSQAYSATYGPFENLVLMNNTVTDGTVLIQGAFNGPDWTGFVVEGNTIGAGGVDTNNWQGAVALWSNTTHLAGSVAGTVVNDFAAETTTTIDLSSDVVVLNSNQNASKTQLIALDTAELANLPVGFETTFTTQSMQNWALQANSSWNTFGSNVAIGAGGITIRLNANHLFDLVPAGSASKLAITQTPTAGTAGTALAPAVTVSVENQAGSVVTGDSSTVTLTIAGGVFAGGATSITAQAINGVATFSNLIIDAVGTYNLIATDGSYAGASSGLIAIGPAAASKVVFTQMPATGVAGQELNPPVMVAVEDQFGNVITSDNSSTVTLTLNGGTFAGGTTTATSTASNGVAIFNGLIINAGGTVTFTASDGSLTGATSGNLAISGSASAQQLAFSQGPSGMTAGVTGTAVRVSVLQSGSVVTSDNSTVTLTLSGGVFAGGGTTVTAQAVNGVATFSNLIINAAGSYTLSASDGSDTGATSSSFVVAPAAASKLAVAQTPSAGTAGQALGTALQVAVEDAFGNVVTSNSSTVVVSVASGPGGIAGGGTPSVFASSGLAKFSNLIFNTAGTYTLTITDGSLTGVTTGSFIVNPAAASKLLVTQSPGSGTAGQALGTALKIAVEDAFGNVVTSNGSSVTVTVGTGPGGLAAGSTTSIAATSGVATFSNLVLNTAGSYTLSVSDGALTTAGSGTFTISPAAASTLAFVQTPSSGTANQALSPSLQVAVKDAFGNVVTNNTSTVNIAMASGPGGFLVGSTTSMAAVNGMATFSNLMLNTVGTYTLRVTDGTLANATSGSIAVGASSASKLAITQAPASGTAGQALGTALKIAVQDSSGNLVSSNASTVTVAVLSGPGTFAAGTTTSVAAVNGVATFSNLIFNTAGAYTLSINDGSLTGTTTATITVNPAAASKLVITQTPSSGTAGQALGTALKVAIQDTFGNVVTSNTSTISVAVATGPGTSASGSSTSVAAVNGVATFSSLIFNTAGTYTFSVSDGALTGATTGSVTVNPAAASKLAITQSPTTGSAGQALGTALKIAVEDSFGNAVTSNTSTVTVAVATGPGGFASGSTTTVTAVNGAASFSNLAFNTAGTYTLSVADGALTGATSGSIVVSASTAGKLAITQTPTTGNAGSALGTSLKIAIEDASGNIVASNTSTVTVAVATGPGSFASGSTTSVAAVGGVATFSNLIFNTAGTYTISVSDGSLTGVTSATITVSPAAASKLVITQTPTSGTAGQALGTAFKVAVEDAFGNIITSNTSTVALAVSSGPGAFASGSTTSVAAVAGVATFSNLIFNAAGSYTLGASDGTLTGATSGSFGVSPAAASKLAITQTPSSGVPGQALSPSITVAVEDAFGNVVTSNTSTVAVTVATGPGAFASGSTTSVAAASGVATFSNLVLNTAGAYTIKVSDGTLTSATSGSISVSASAASKLAITQTPTAGTAGQALGTALKVAVQDASGNVITSNSSTVTVTVASGPGTFASGSTTSVAAVNGVATLSNLIFNTAGTYTLSVSDGSLTGATTATITVGAAAASKLAITQTPSSGTAGQALGTAFKIAVQDAFGNVVTSNASTMTLTVGSGPGSFASGTTTSVAAVNGVATFSNLIFNTAGAYTIRVADGSLTGATSGSVTVSPAAASTLSLMQTPASGTVNQALTPSLQVAVKDQFGNIVTSNTSTITVAMASGPGGFAAGSTMTASAVNGVATFSNLMLNTAGAYTLSLSDGALTGITTGSIAVSPVAGTASKLVITQAPTTGTAGQAVSLTVAIEDASGNVITGNNSTVTVVVAGGPARLANGSTTSMAAVNGVATFNSLFLNTVGTYTLSVSDGSLTGATSGSITVSAGAASKLFVSQAPGAGTAGQVLNPAVIVAVQDAYGNAVTSNSSTITLAVGSGPVGFASGSTLSATAVKGVATFSNVILNAAGNYVLVASGNSLTSGSSTPITINAAAAGKLFVSQTPATGSAGQALNPGVTVSVQDAFGNVITSNTSTVTLAVSSGPAGFATGTTTSAAAVGGVATFSNLLFNTAGSYVLNATDGALTAAKSSSIAVNPAAATKLVLLTTPTSGTAGKALVSTLQIAIEDQFGNVIKSNTSAVTLAVNSGPGQIANTSTTSVAAVNGVATFSNLIFNTAGTYTVKGVQGALTSAASGNITVSAGVASKLAFTQTPATGTAGKALTPGIKVAVEDAFGNVVTSNTSKITVIVNSGPNGFASGSTVTVAAVNGVATFNKLLCTRAGNYLIGASDGSLTKAASTNITITPSTATKLAIIATPGSGKSRLPLGTLQVAVEDQFGNIVTSNNSTLTVTKTAGAGTLASNATTTVAAVNGIATFSNLILTTKGNYTLKVTDGTLTAISTHSIVVTG